jgi:glucokinase
MAVIGIDLGGSKIAAAVFSAEGTLLTRDVKAVDGRSGSDVGALAVDLARTAVEQTTEAVTGVGMCVPGIYYPDSGRVWAPNISGWKKYPLRDELRAAFDPEISVRIESDRACYILGEIWRGAAQGCTDAIFLAVGTGIGAGIVSGGQIINGKHGIAGAIGWMALDRPYRKGYETFGCFEFNASGDGLARVARDMAPPDHSGAPGFGELSTARDIFEAYDAGDEVARRVIENAIDLWGMAVANLVSLFNPEKVIFGGGVFGPALGLLDRIRAEATRWAQPISMKHVVFEAAVLGSDAGLYGAARLALEPADAGNNAQSQL